MYIYQSPYDGRYYAINSLLDDDDDNYCLDENDLNPIFDCASKENEYFDDLTWDGKIKWLFENHYITMTEVKITFGKNKWENGTEDE